VPAASRAAKQQERPPGTCTGTAPPPHVIPDSPVHPDANPFPATPGLRTLRLRS
jgi:hypothetical protein